jgi:methionyl-tRNA formyltransferase
MDKRSLRIVFMGTPEFAVESLRQLTEGGYHVVGVVTTPDKAVGRHGSVLQPCAVKVYAEAQGLQVLQPERLRDSDFLEALRAWRADVQVVVAFRMLPEVVWNMPRLGTFNLHASLLPMYRGAAPINWAIINGEKETGVTTFFLTHEIDTGRIIGQKRLSVEDTEDAGIVHDRLMRLGAELVTETVDALLRDDDGVATVEQSALVEPGVVLHSAPKIFHETCRIEWQQPAKRIYDFIRGLSPYPAAWTEWVAEENGDGLRLKVFRAEALAEKHALPAGSIRSDGATFLDVAAGEGYVRLHSLQLAGKKRLSVRDFLHGVRILAQTVR